MEFLPYRLRPRRRFCYAVPLFDCSMMNDGRCALSIVFPGFLCRQCLTTPPQQQQPPVTRSVADEGHCQEWQCGWSCGERGAVITARMAERERDGGHWFPAVSDSAVSRHSPARMNIVHTGRKAKQTVANLYWCRSTGRPTLGGIVLGLGLVPGRCRV